MLRIIILITAGIPIFGFGQESLGLLSRSESNLQIYNQGEYRRLVAELDDEEMIKLSSIIRLGTATGHEIKKAENWVVENPEHSFSNDVKFSLLKHSFFYPQDSVYTYEIDPSVLGFDDQKDFFFISSLSRIENEEYRLALEELNKSNGNSLAEKEVVSYYQGYSSFYLGLFKESLDYFNDALSNDQVKTSSQYFVARIYSQNGDYDEVIYLGMKNITDEVSVENALFHQLIGEAYAKKDNPSEASDYFAKAISLHPIPDPSLYYQAAISKFRLGDEEKAIAYFKKSGLGNTQYAFLSAYQLGHIYLNQKEYQRAENAFSEAIKSDDKIIKEESLYYRILISTHLQDFNTVLETGTQYVELFPDGKYLTEVNDYIAESYLRSSNYDLAIEYLESVGQLSDVQKSIYQKVTFKKAQLLINDQLFDDGKVILKKSLKYPTDKILENETYFLIAEIDLINSNYQNALTWYYKQSIISPESWYGIGYCYYNLSKYSEAIDAFENHLAISDIYLDDSRLRRADCLFALKKYDEAFEGYSGLSSDYEDYANYQKGLVKQYASVPDSAIVFFKRVSNVSEFYPNALLEIGNTYLGLGDFSNAETYYSKYIFDFNNTDKSSKAYLNRAICRINLEKNDLALQDYQQILRYHIQSKEALSAILGLQELDGKGVNVENLNREIARFKNANPDNTSIEAVEFNAAKTLYYDLDYSSAITSLNDFISSYPNSSYLTESTYYLGESNYRMGNLEEAIFYFEKLQDLENLYTARVLKRLGEIHFQLGSFDKAINAYDQLRELGNSPKDLYIARYGLVEVFIETKNYEGAISMLVEIENGSWKPFNAEEVISINKGRAWLGLDELDKSKNEFNKWVENNSSIGAESRFNLAFIEYKTGNYDEALEMLFELNSSMGSFIEWIDRSYLLIADIYLKKDELFQAKATLSSIIENSENPEIIRLASEKLTGIESSVKQDSSKVDK